MCTYIPYIILNVIDNQNKYFYNVEGDAWNIIIATVTNELNDQVQVVALFSYLTLSLSVIFWRNLLDPEKGNTNRNKYK